VAKTKTRIANGQAVLPVTRWGAGQGLVFFNGAGSTQAIWNSVIRRLRGRYEVATFDFRSHGQASTSADHSFEAFLSDADCVMAMLGAARPIIVGWSLGADLALAYAAAHPGAVAGLVLIDGAVPLSDRLVEDERGMRRLLNSQAMKFGVFLLRMTPYRYALSGDDFADITLDLDRRRQHLLDTYAKVDCPITMLLATRSAGKNSVARSRRNNRLWREGGERLAAAHRSITLKWLKAGHQLPLAKPQALAREIDAFAKRVARGPDSDGSNAP
jgi:pimeloyl-ACP methyl ester carboxylesterase